VKGDNYGIRPEEKTQRKHSIGKKKGLPIGREETGGLPAGMRRKKKGKKFDNRCTAKAKKSLVGHGSTLSKEERRCKRHEKRFAQDGARSTSKQRHILCVLETETREWGTLTQTSDGDVAILKISGGSSR